MCHCQGLVPLIDLNLYSCFLSSLFFILYGIYFCYNFLHTLSCLTFIISKNLYLFNNSKLYLPYITQIHCPANVTQVFFFLHHQHANCLSSQQSLYQLYKYYSPHLRTIIAFDSIKFTIIYHKKSLSWFCWKIFSLFLLLMEPMLPDILDLVFIESCSEWTCG